MPKTLIYTLSLSPPPTQLLKLLSNYLHALKETGDSNVFLSNKALSNLRNLPNIIATKSDPGGDKSAALEQIKQRISEAESTSSLRDTLVFSSGSPHSRIMFVGEAPGEEEEIKREPFVGPAGKLLTKIIQTMGMRREETYISNIVKFRPRIDGESQGSANRKPTKQEMQNFLPFLLDEIKIVKPELIFALGGTAMTGLLGIESSVNSARGRLHNFREHSVIVTYHPSFLLRSGSNSDKRKLWEDILMGMDHLSIPVSDKQRNYFK